MKQISGGCWMLSGNVEIEELVEAYPQLQIPTEDVEYETVAGFVMHETGRIPIPTEEVVIGSMRLTITKGTRSRIELVKLQLLD
jgi:CBS domain containing-hemolysin-like protein